MTVLKIYWWIIKAKYQFISEVRKWGDAGGDVPYIFDFVLSIASVDAAESEDEIDLGDGGQVKTACALSNSESSLSNSSDPVYNRYESPNALGQHCFH